MEEKNIAGKENELTKEEVNVYAGCGDPRYVCRTDCMFTGGAFISPYE